MANTTGTDTVAPAATSTELGAMTVTALLSASACFRNDASMR